MKCRAGRARYCLLTRILVLFASADQHNSGYFYESGNSQNIGTKAGSYSEAAATVVLFLEAFGGFCAMLLQIDAKTPA